MRSKFSYQFYVQTNKLINKFNVLFHILAQNVLFGARQPCIFLAKIKQKIANHLFSVICYCSCCSEAMTLLLRHLRSLTFESFSETIMLHILVFQTVNPCHIDTFTSVNPAILCLPLALMGCELP